MKKLFSLLALIATGVLPQTAPQAVTGSVSGLVVDADTRMPTGKYYVLATNNPPPGIIARPAKYVADESPENLSMLLRMRSQGLLVEVTPNVTTQVSVVPKN